MGLRVAPHDRWPWKTLALWCVFVFLWFCGSVDCASSPRTHRPKNNAEQRGVGTASRRTSPSREGWSGKREEPEQSSARSAMAAALPFPQSPGAGIPATKPKPKLRSPYVPQSCWEGGCME